MKQILYIEIDETITSIYDRVKPLQAKKVYLVVPKKAQLFQSTVNLKILKKRIDELKKSFVLVSTDHRGLHLAKEAGIETQTGLEVERKKLPEEENVEIAMMPMQARRNEVFKENPKRAHEKKLTIREFIQEYRSKKKKKSEDVDMPGSTFIRPSRKLFVLLFTLSLGLFFLISYIALPGAKVLIKPKFDNTSHTVNVILADKRKNQNLIQENRPNVVSSEIINIEMRQTKVFNVTSKEFEGENAEGVVEIINSTQEPWDFKESTRLQSKEGVIFRIEDGVTVPAATYDETGEYIHGRVAVKATADEFGLYNEPIGERGNMSEGQLIIPGLTKFNQELIWAEIMTPFEGGSTSYYKVVKEEDIESAKAQIEDSLILLARQDLRTRLKEMNELNNTNLSLLDDRRYLKTNVLELRVSDDLLGTRTDQFEVYARIDAEGVAYDANELFTILKKALMERTHPDRQVRESSVDPDSITYEVIDEDEELGQIKITATIAGIEEYVIDPSKEAGKRFGESVKEKILTLPVSEAENLIHNLPEVDEVQIKTWPFWVDHIPRIPENIKIGVLKGA